MSYHAETAAGQLELADDHAQTREQMHANALAAAHVHALLDLAEAVRYAGISMRPPLPFDPSFP